MKSSRSYILRLYGSKSKFEDLRWSAYQFSKLTNSFISHLYFNNVDFYSTKGLGLLGNQAQRKALGIVKSKKSNEQDNGHKKSCPILNVQQCFANIARQSSKHEFNYKISFMLGFSAKSKSRYLFAKGTKPLKIAFKQHWKPSNQCEIFYEPKDGHWYVRVFVSKLVEKAQAKNQSIGVDVGINHIIATSNGFLGNSLSKRLKKLNQSKKEKQRQLNLAKNRNQKYLVDKLKSNLTKNKNKNINKTVIKQLLDKEAKRLIACGLATSSNLIVEDPKVLANLQSKGFVRWAKTYLAYRLQVLGQEQGVFVVFSNPAYTSLTCYKCGDQDKKSRDGIKFHCQKCGYQDHADLNAAKNLSLKGQNFVDKFVLKKISSSTVRASLGLVK